MTVPIPPPPAPRRDGRRHLLAGTVASLAALALLGAATLAVVALRGAAPEAPPAGETSAPAAPGAPTSTPSATPGAPEATSEPPAQPPSPSPTTDGEPGESASSPLPGPPPDGLAEVSEQVAALRGLPAGEPLDARVVAPGDLAAKLTELAFAEYDEGELDLDGRLLVALRLLDEEDDLRATIEELYGAQVLGLYVVEEEVLYIGGARPRLSAAQRITAAHEVLHALQDRAFDLEKFMDLDTSESDAQLARLALVEGDAVLTQELWSLEHQSAGEREEAQEESRRQSPEALLGAPAYVRESLLFPYTHGARFVEALFVRDGFDGVDAAFADPPVSTRQILRPETYLAGEGHSGAAVTTTPGEGWDEASTYTFGEFDVDQWLSVLGEERLEVTAAWDGGQTRHWHRGGDDAVALALRLSTPEAARAACDAAPAWYASVAGGEPAGEGLQRGEGDWMAYRCGDAEILVGIAPDAATAGRLAGR